MAIFGNLSDIPLSDIITLGAKGLGRMSITHHETGKIYVLNFYEKDLISLLVDQTPLTDVFSVTSAVAFLMKTKDADFIIERQLREDCMQQFDFLLPVDQLVASVMTAISELESLRCHFPSEKTVFMAPCRKEVWLGDELSQFYEQCYTLLARGASGEDLAAHTGMSLERVLLNLYRLRASGLINPSRAVAPTSLPAKTSEARTRLSLFKIPAANRPPKQVPYISFDENLPTEVQEAPVTTRAVTVPIRDSAAPASNLPLPTTLQQPCLSESDSAPPVPAISANLREVHITRPNKSVAGMLLRRIAKLCRI